MEQGIGKAAQQAIGVLEIDSKRLKNELNLREARLTEIKSYVQNLAKSRCISLIDTYKEHHRSSRCDLLF